VIFEVEELDGVERLGALCCVAVRRCRCCSVLRMVDLAGVSGRDAGRGRDGVSSSTRRAWRGRHRDTFPGSALGNSLIARLEDHNVSRHSA